MILWSRGGDEFGARDLPGECLVTEDDSHDLTAGVQSITYGGGGYADMCHFPAFFCVRPYVYFVIDVSMNSYIANQRNYTKIHP